MPVYQGHNVVCEEGGHRECDCRCSGLCHGWPGAMAIARRSRSGKLLEWRKRMDEVGSGGPVVPPAEQSHNQQMRTRQVVVDESRIALALGFSDVVAAEQARRGFGGDAARSDLIWQRIWSLARGIHRDVLPDLVRVDPWHTGREESTLAPRLAGMHWWCELVTWMIRQLDEDGLWMAGRSADLARRFGQFWSDRGGVDELFAPRLARTAASGAWAKIGDLPRIAEPLGLERALVALRMLGTFMCRQPEGHGGVIRTCLGPLAQHVPENIHVRLRTAFPDWPEGTREHAVR